MVTAKKQEEEKQQAARQENGLSLVEEAVSGLAPEEPEMQLEERAEDGAETRHEEKQAALAQKSGASSREKRESRRRRGLEHNKLQNKHVAFSFEEPSVTPENEIRESEQAVEKDTVSPENEAKERHRVADRQPVPLESKGVPALDLKQEAPKVDSDLLENRSGGHKNQIRGSQSFTCLERPSELALNLHNSLVSSKSFRGEKSKQGASKELGSPTSFQIQRYQDDPNKLRDKRERWKGKRRMACRQSNTLSQSMEERSDPPQPQPLT